MHDDQLARYLLGTLPAQDHERIDARVLSDAQLFDELCAVENELSYDYAIGLLAADDRLRFEHRFLHRPAVQERVQTARSLLQTIRWTDRYPQQRAPLRWLPIASAAAAAAALVVVGWLAFDNLRVREELAAVRSEAAAATAAAEAAERRAAQAATPLQPNEPSRPTADAPPLVSAPRAPLIVSLALQPGLVRSDAAPRRLRLVAETTGVRLQLELPAAALNFASYRATLRTPDNVEVWSETTSLPRPESRVLVLTLPAPVLVPNDYELTVFGIPVKGEPEEVANYAFSIVR